MAVTLYNFENRIKSRPKQNLSSNIRKTAYQHNQGCSGKPEHRKDTAALHCSIHCQKQQRQPADRQAGRITLPENKKTCYRVTPTPYYTRPKADLEDAPKKQIGTNTRNKR